MFFEVICNSVNKHFWKSKKSHDKEGTVEQVKACVPVMQWAQVQSPVVTNFLGEV